MIFKLCDKRNFNFMSQFNNLAPALCFVFFVFKKGSRLTEFTFCNCNNLYFLFVVRMILSPETFAVKAGSSCPNNSVCRTRIKQQLKTIFLKFFMLYIFLLFRDLFYSPVGYNVNGYYQKKKDTKFHRLFVFIY